jgi:hypothetical protein
VSVGVFTTCSTFIPIGSGCVGSFEIGYVLHAVTVLSLPDHRDSSSSARLTGTFCWTAATSTVGPCLLVTLGDEVV